MYYEFENYTEEEYLAEYAFRNDPTQWKEHAPSDDAYVHYVESTDLGFRMKEKILAYLLRGDLSAFERERAKYLLRAIERDIRDLKIAYDNEQKKKASQSRV